MTRFHTCALTALAFFCGQPALATNQVLDAWVAKYPTSTLPARMQAVAGSNCYVCHHPSSFANPGNCYREDLITLLAGGATVTEAIDQLDLVDSDGDGVANGIEATTARQDQPGEIGYNMGLVGPTGTDPCATNTTEPVTNQLETPPQDVPTVSTWGLVVFILLLLTGGSVGVRRVCVGPRT